MSGERRRKKFPDGKNQLDAATFTDSEVKRIYLATDNLGATNGLSAVVVTKKQCSFVKLESPQSGGGFVQPADHQRGWTDDDIQTATNLTDWATVRR